MTPGPSRGQAGHTDPDKDRTGGGRKHEDSNTKARNHGQRTAGIQEDTGLASVARGQQQEKRMKHALAGQRTTAGQEEDKTRTQSLWAHQPVWPAFFPKREPQTVNRLVNKNIFKVIYIYIQYYMWPWVKTWSSKPW